MNNIQEAQLLRENRSALVSQLIDLGFSDIDDNTPLAELADYIRWAGGLLDIRLAVINKNTREYSYYTEDQWNTLSASAKTSCVKLGLRIRAERQDFIIAKENVKPSNGSSDNIPWSSVSVDIKGLTNYGEGSTGYIKDIDGEANTNLILAHGAANNMRFEAAEQARAYKAATMADGGFEDPTIWSLPAVGQLWIIYKHQARINAALTTFFGVEYIFSDTWYWTSTEYNPAYAISLSMSYGSITYLNKASSYRVRSVANVPAP